MRRSTLLAMLLALSACGDDSDDGRDQGRDDGTDSAREDAGGAADGSLDARTNDVLDARTDVPGDAGDARGDGSLAVPSDGGGGDATGPVNLALRQRVCGNTSEFGAPLPAPNRREAQNVARGFSFVEGAVWVDALEQLFFSDMNMRGDNSKGPPSRIVRLKPPRETDVLVASSGSNGIASWEGKTLLAATHDTRSLTFFDAETGARSDIAIKVGGKAFNSPNDLAIRDDGTVFFSDPNYQRGPRADELDRVTGLYRVKLAKGTTSAEATLLDGEFRQPNGVALSPDQKTLYVGSADAQIFKYDVASDGSLSNKQPFARPGGSDGLTIDCAGNLYVTSGTVEVFNPQGEKLGEIEVGESPTNVAFGGKDRRTLYITAGTSLYSIELNVPGYPY